MNRAVFTAATMAAAGAVVFLCLPVLVGLIIDTLGLSESEAGAIASTYFASYLLASGMSPWWAGRVSPRVSGAIAYLLMSCGLGLASGSEGVATLSLTMGVAGVGGGMLFSLGVAIVSSGPDTDRGYGWMLVAQQIVAALFLFCVPMWVVPSWGMPGALLSLAGLCLIMAPTLSLAPRQLDQTIENTDAVMGNARTGGASTALILLVVHFAGLSALWAFVERIGVDKGLTATDIGTALSFSMLGGLAGALLVTQLADRLGRQAPLWLATLIFIGVCGGYYMPLQWLSFLLVTGLLSFAWNFVLAYQMGIISDLDQAGSRAVLIPAAQGLGAVIGPLLGGWILGLGGQPALLAAVALLCSLTVIMFSALARRLGQ